MAVGGGAISSDVVIKSPTCRRLYRYIQLVNGLCALFVHNPDIYSNQPYGERKLGDSEEDEDEDEDEDDADEDFGEGDSGEEDDVEEEDEEEEGEEKGLKGSLQKKFGSILSTYGVFNGIDLSWFNSFSSIELSDSY